MNDERRTTNDVDLPKWNIGDPAPDALWWNNVAKKWRPVKNARYVTFEGFEKFQFTIGHTWLSSFWTVTERSTGFSIGLTQRTRDLALRGAFEALSKAGALSLSSQIAKAKRRQRLNS